MEVSAALGAPTGLSQGDRYRLHRQPPFGGTHCQALWRSFYRSADCLCGVVEFVCLPPTRYVCVAAAEPKGKSLPHLVDRRPLQSAVSPAPGPGGSHRAFWSVHDHWCLGFTFHADEWLAPGNPFRLLARMRDYSGPVDTSIFDGYECRDFRDDTLAASLGRPSEVDTSCGRISVGVGVHSGCRV